MKRPPQRRTFNPGRKIATGIDVDLAALAKTVSYKGSPYHKANPGDFRLTPPALPRLDKTLCDRAQIFKRGTALKLLRSGVRKGLVSERFVGDWPQNVWSVARDGTVFEAQLDNRETGTYHGYPLQADDGFRAVVLARWNGE